MLLANMSKRLSELSIRLELLKEATNKGTSDRYYGKDADAQAKLVAKQFKNTNFRHDMSQLRQDKTDGTLAKIYEQLDKIELEVKEHHNK